MQTAADPVADEAAQAGFWLRVGAKLIDQCLFGLVELLGLAITAYLNALGHPPWVLAGGYVFSSVLWYVYIYEMTHRHGQTIGKRMAAIQVQLADGRLPDAGQVLRRTAVEALFDLSYIDIGLLAWFLAPYFGLPVATAATAGLSLGGLVALLDPLRVAFRADRRAIHDLAGGTFVLRTAGQPVRHLATVAVLAFLLPQALMFFLGRPYLIEAYYVPSGSMEHTIEIGDRILANKLVHRLRPPLRSEIIMFESPKWVSPGEKPTIFVKRVVGIAGDRLRVHNGRLYRNGKPVDEPYTLSAPDYEWPDGAADGAEVTVPEGHVVVFGDNRNNSNDSHAWERTSEDGRKVEKAPFLPESSIRGKLAFRFWPPDRFGTVAQERQGSGGDG